MCWDLGPTAGHQALLAASAWGGAAPPLPQAGVGPWCRVPGGAWAQCSRPASPSSVLSRMFRMSASSSVSSSGCWATYGCTHWTWGQSEGGGGGGRASTPRPCAAPHPANPAHRLTWRCLPSPAAAEKGSFFWGGGGTWLQKKEINVAGGSEETTRGWRDEQAVRASRTRGEALGEGRRWGLGAVAEGSFPSTRARHVL